MTYINKPLAIGSVSGVKRGARLRKINFNVLWKIYHE